MGPMPGQMNTTTKHNNIAVPSLMNEQGNIKCLSPGHAAAESKMRSPNDDAHFKRAKSIKLSNKYLGKCGIPYFQNNFFVRKHWSGTKICI